MQEELEASSQFCKEVEISHCVYGGVKCLHLNLCLGWRPCTCRSTCCSGECRNALGSYRFAEGKVAVSRSKKFSEQIAAGMERVEGRAEAALLDFFPGAEMGKLGAGFNLPDSPNRCKSQHNCGNMWGSCSAYTRRYWLWRRLAAAKLPSQMFCLVKQRVVTCIPSGFAHWAVQQAALRFNFFPPLRILVILQLHTACCASVQDR